MSFEEIIRNFATGLFALSLIGYSCWCLVFFMFEHVNGISFVEMNNFEKISCSIGMVLFVILATAVFVGATFCTGAFIHAIYP